VNDKDRSIIAQVAAKVAGSVCMGKGKEGVLDYLVVVETVYNDIIDRAGGTATASPAAPVAAAAPAAPPEASAVETVQAAFPGAEIAIAPGADIPPMAVPTFPAPASVKPSGGARKVGNKPLDSNGFVTDGKQAAWNVAFLCAGTKVDGDKLVVFDNKFKKAKGAQNLAAGLSENADGGYKAGAPDFNISEVGAKHYQLGNERIPLWINQAPTHIQDGTGAIHVFNIQSMHDRCGS